MQSFFRFFNRAFVEHGISAIAMLLLVLFVRDFVPFFITVFLCASLFNLVWRTLRSVFISASHRVLPPLRPIFHLLAGEKTLLTMLYVLFAVICIIAFSDIAPALVTDMLQLLRTLSETSSVTIGIPDLTSTLKQWQSLSEQFGDFMKIFSSQADGSTELFARIWHFSGVFLQIIFGYIVSYIWLLEHTRVHDYFAHMKQSPFRFLYDDFRSVFHRVTRSFGLVFHAQGKIALVNTVLTAIGLAVIGIIYTSFSLQGTYLYPYFLALVFITFITSFVPILGVFISGIPILFAGMSVYPGWGFVISVIVMLFVIHAIEGYFLNPRIVGQSLNIPAPIIFIILMVAEHLMGISGFFLGVPLYILIIDTLKSLGERWVAIQKNTP